MAILYGSAVGSTGGNIRQSTRSFAHARMRETLSNFDGTPTTSDELVIGLFKSNDRIKDIRFGTDGAATTAAFDLGLWEVEVRNEALSLTVIDQDLFASARSATTSIGFSANTSVFSESGTLDDFMDRGKSLWELAALGAASYTEDPGLDVAIVVKPTATFNAATEMIFSVEYVAGD